MIKKNPISLVIVFILFSCIKKSEQINYQQELDITQNGSIKFSEIFSNVSYLPLTADVTGVYDMVDKMVITSNYIYMFDFYNTKSLYVFEIDGRLKYKLSKKGNGPGEYVEVNDFNINETKGIIEILDTRNALIQYDLAGNFINRVKLPLKAYKFQYLSKNKYLFYSPEMGGVDNDDCMFWEYDIVDNSKICSPTQMEKNIGFFTERNIFSCSEKKIFFSKTFHNEIYEYEDSQMRPKYKLKFGERGYHHSELNNIKSGGDIINLLNTEQKAFNKPGLFVSEKWLITTYIEGEIGYVFFDRNEKIAYNGTSLTNDIDYGISKIRIMGVFNNKVVSLVSAHSFLERYGQMNTMQRAKFASLVDGLNENSPPIIQFLELKG